MQKLLLAALVAAAGWYAWAEYGGGPGLTTSRATSGPAGPGFSAFGKAPGTVARGALAAVGN